MEQKRKLVQKIAFLGASVTKGEMVPRGKDYVTILEEKWKNAFPVYRQTEFINAGTSGTLSGNAMFSVGELLEQKPDVVFLDYSVNDTGDAWLTEAFESLVYRLVRQGCSVVIVLFCNQHGHCTRGAMTKIARHYGLPLLDVGKLVMEHIQNGDFSWDDFASDYVHPNEFGHVFIADEILRFVEQERPENIFRKPVCPEQFCFQGIFCHLKIVPVVEYKKQCFRYEDIFSTIVVEYTQTPSPSNCSMDIFVDGKRIKTIERYSEFSWDNRVVTFLLSEEENSRHVVELRPAAGAHCSDDELDDFQIVFGLGHVS